MASRVPLLILMIPTTIDSVLISIIYYFFPFTPFSPFIFNCLDLNGIESVTIYISDYENYYFKSNVGCFLRITHFLPVFLGMHLNDIGIITNSVTQKTISSLFIIFKCHPFPTLTLRGLNYFIYLCKTGKIYFIVKWCLWFY